MLNRGAVSAAVAVVRVVVVEVARDPVPEVEALVPVGERGVVIGRSVELTLVELTAV